MPAQQLVEAREDFRGGRNSAVSPDKLNLDELVDATNVRLSAEYGGFQKRSGTRRMHATAVGSGNAIKGVTQWDSPSGKQIVAISNGRLYHKTTELGEFAEVIPGAGDEFSTTVAAIFAPFRANTSGAPLRLFIASGGKYYKWDGTILTRLTLNNVPAADLIIPYHVRMFAHDTNFVKNVAWSVLGDAENFVAAVGLGGGTAGVDMLNTEKIVAYEVVGSSLMIAGEDSIARFTGHSSDDIIIAQDTEGIASDIGVVGPLALRRAEGLAFGLSDRGPYLFSERTATPIGLKIEPDFDALDRANIAKTCIGYHRGRKELFIAVPGASDSGLNKTVFVFSTRLQAWVGPWTYTFGITDLTRYEDANGDEWLIAGCSDGFVRHMDTGALDDVLSSGSGGTAITMIAELPPLFFAAGPNSTKTIFELSVQADLATNTNLQVRHAFDGASLTSRQVTASPTGGIIKSYRLFVHEQGKRLRLQFFDSSTDLPIVNGFLLYAYLYEGRY